MLRAASIALAVCSLALPAAWAQIQVAAYDEQMRPYHGFTCGMPVLGIYLLALLAAGLLSAISTALGFAAWKRSNTRLGWGRGIELAVPACLAIVCFLAISVL